MIFTDLPFIPFLLFVLAVHWALPGNRPRKLWLLGCSYLFYAAWDVRFLSLIVVSTLVDYVAALLIARSATPAGRKAALGLSITVNLGLLGTFKYFDFFIESAAALLGDLGIPTDVSTLGLVLPVGISFYTFQTLSYTIDAYRGRLEPTRDIADVALFVAFFPQLVAGPIVRAQSFLPQLREARRFAQVDVRACLVLLAIGFFKKAVLSDAIVTQIDLYFAAPASFDAASAWLASLLFAVQIYCDFSGYSDMAIAIAGLLGYRLGQNFDFPYLAPSRAEVWRRWHMSLSSWMRDYVYFPLGGSRGSRLVQHRNVILTFVLAGLWHGAAWTFVAWGLFHGVALVIARELAERRPDATPPTGLRLLAWVAVTHAVTVFAIVFFRAPSLQNAFVVLGAALTFASPGSRSLPTVLFGLWVVAAVVHVVMYRTGSAERLWRALPGPVFAGGYGVFWALAFAFASPEVKPFYYFQF